MTKSIISALSNDKLQSFIFSNEATDERKLVLKNSSILEVPSSIVAQQIAGRRKAKSKIPSYYNAKGIVYPPSLNLEQCSSELTARFKAALVAKEMRALKIAAIAGADITGGFGVDALFLASLFHEFHFVDQDENLLSIAAHNHEVMGLRSVQYHSQSAESFLASTSEDLDFIFIDPSRRNNSKKVFRLEDGQPNPIQLHAQLLQKTRLLLLKASPMLDLQRGLKDLGTVDKIFVVGVDDECKELLFLCSSQSQSNSDPMILAVNLSTSSTRPDKIIDEFIFTFTEESKASPSFSEPLAFLYEPAPWILKAGAFKLAASRYGLKKIEVNTHLYTSDQLVETFPGKILRIEQLNPESYMLGKLLPGRKANIFVRNYPNTPEQLKKKLKLQDGGDKYLVGFSGMKSKYLAVAIRLK